MPNSAPLSTYEWLMGKRTRDINLPNQSGNPDPNVKDTSVNERIGDAKKGYDILMNLPSMKALKDKK